MTETTTTTNMTATTTADLALSSAIALSRGDDTDDLANALFGSTPAGRKLAEVRGALREQDTAFASLMLDLGIKSFEDFSAPRSVRATWVRALTRIADKVGRRDAYTWSAVSGEFALTHVGVQDAQIKALRLALGVRKIAAFDVRIVEIFTRGLPAQAADEASDLTRLREHVATLASPESAKAAKAARRSLAWTLVQRPDGMPDVRTTAKVGLELDDAAGALPAAVASDAMKIQRALTPERDRLLREVSAAVAKVRHEAEDLAALAPRGPDGLTAAERADWKSLWKPALVLSRRSLLGTSLADALADAADTLIEDHPHASATRATWAAPLQCRLALAAEPVVLAAETAAETAAE